MPLCSAPRPASPGAPLRCAFLFLLLTAGLCAQAPLSGKDVLKLLEAGVPGDLVAAYLERRGEPQEVTRTQVARAEELDAGEALLEVLSASLDSRRILDRLAQAYTPVPLEGSALKALVPRGWITSRRRLAGKGSMLLIREALELEDDWLTQPTLLVMLQPRTPFPPAVEGPLAEVVAENLTSRLYKGGVSSRVVHRGAGRVGRRTVPEHAIQVKDPARQLMGSLRFRLRVLQDGTLLVTGCATGDTSAGELLQRFEDLSSSLEVPGEDLEQAAPRSVLGQTPRVADRNCGR